MIEVDYSLEIQTALAEPFDEFSSIIEINYARSLNQIGSLSVRVPMKYAPRTLRRDMRILAWRRTVFGPKLAAGTVWLIRRIRYRAEDDTLLITAEDPISLLKRRIVAYTPQTTYADKTLEEFGLVFPDDRLRLDNMMRAYVRENYTADVLDATRDLSDYFSVEEDRNLAPYSEKQAAWASLLAVCQDLARTSEEKGMRLTFDVLPQPDTPTYRFRVYYGTQGTDRGFSSDRPLVFSRSLGNLTDVEVEENYSDEATSCFVLGFDTGSSRVVEVVNNEEAIRATPFNRIEFTTEFSESDVETVLQEEGLAALQGRTPKMRIEGKTVDTGDIMYGRDYEYGDKVVVQEGGVQMEAMVSALNIAMRDGRETPDIRLTGDIPL